MPARVFNLPLGETRVCLRCCSGGQSQRSVEDGATEVLDEPELGVVLGHALELANTGTSRSAVANSVARSLQDNGEVHTEDTGVGIILDSKIDMLFDTESEVTLMQN